MYVELELPDVKVDYQIFGNFWLKSMFGGGQSTHQQVAILSSTYVRLVEASIREYNMGIVCTREYWSTHDKIALGSIQYATSYFESCISDMHRAINCFTRLRRHPHLGSLASINSRKPKFVAAAVHGQIRNARNEIHHLESLLMKGEIAPDKSSSIRADGPEIAHPTEHGQTIKTIDRLCVGNCEILASDISSWLIEMSQFCDLMNHSGSKTGVVA